MGALSLRGKPRVLAIVISCLSMDPLIPGMIPAPAGGTPRIYTTPWSHQEGFNQMPKTVGDESRSILSDPLQRCIVRGCDSR